MILLGYDIKKGKKKWIEIEKRERGKCEKRKKFKREKYIISRNNNCATLKETRAESFERLAQRLAS